MNIWNMPKTLKNRFDKDHYKYFLCEIAGGLCYYYMILIWFMQDSLRKRWFNRHFLRDAADVIGLKSEKYHQNSSGEYAVLIVINPDDDYHWYCHDSDGKFHKPGLTKVITGVKS